MCQYCMYLLPIELKIVLKKLKFFSEIKILNNMFISAMHMEDDKFLTACSKYSICQSTGTNWRNDLWRYFETSLQ